MKRRQLLRMLLYGMGTVLGSLVVIPTFLSALSPGWKRSRTESWQQVGSLEDFPVGKVALASVGFDRRDWTSELSTKSVYVWRRKDAEPIVFSRNCTDLSCPIRFDSGSECFFCPCHGGIFAKDGEVMAGPPESPLMRYTTRIKDGVLEIDMRSLPPMT